MGIGKDPAKNRRAIRTYFPILVLVVLGVLFILIAFPLKRPMREILPALTFFDRIFHRNAFFITRSLEGGDGSAGFLYEKFCSEPEKAGRRLDEILRAAWDENAYAAPLMKIFVQESGAIQADRRGMNWAHDPDTAYSCLSSPRPIAYGGDRADEIQRLSAENWDGLPSELKGHLAQLMGRSSPAASRFRTLRRTFDFDQAIIDGDGAFRREDFMEKVLAAADLADPVDLHYAWLSLVYYCEGLDASLKELKDLDWRAELEPIPSDDWFPGGLLYAAQSPFGLVLVGGPGNNLYPAGDVFLLIDLGGCDTYFFDETFHPKEQGGRPCACSTIIDLDGDDFYTGGPGRVAAGVLGFRTLIDLGGADTYKSQGMGLGAGFMGMGLLVDRGGNDKYDSGCFGLGAGTFGLGLLFEEGGDDIFRSTCFSQGFAGPSGFGCLVESTGHDLYFCYPSDEESKSSLCFAQGSFCGPPDGSRGGLGLLSDLQGDDIFRCTSLGQGAAQGKGVALLFDARGYDSYRGRNRCQGFGGLGGVGLLRDCEGFDRYTARGFAQGTGSDASLGLLIDDIGDDEYLARFRSQGRSRASGTGMLYDMGGKNLFSSQAGD